MLKRIIKKITEAFDFKEESERKAQKLREERRIRIEQKNKENEKKTIEEARNKLSEIATEKKEQESKLHYREFKTVLEMVYVEEKANQAKKDWTSKQKEEFDKKFAVNLAKCQKDKEFQEEYALYEEATERGGIGFPQTGREKSINRLLNEILDIHIALSPSFSDNEKRQKIRFKYEKKLDDNKKESERAKAARIDKKRTISI